MQAPSGGADAGAAANSWMANFDFLGAEELIGALGAPADMPFLDPATLNAVYSADQHGQTGHALGPPGVPFAAQQQSLKRPLPDDSDSDDDDCRARPGTSGGKRGKGDGASDAARVKASKEKARRGKINDRFSELAKLIEPSGSEPKTDKPSILADAIKYVQQLTVENHQLRQLNKFLEERVSHYERERGQNLYQQSLMMQGMGGTPGMMPPQAGMMQPQPGMMPSQQPMMPGTQPLMPGASQAQAMPGMMGQPQGMMQPGLMQASGSGPAGMMPTGMMQAPGLASMQQMARSSMSGTTTVAGTGAATLPMAHPHMQTQAMPMMPQQQQQQAAYQQQQQQGQGAQLKSEPSMEQQGDKGQMQSGQGQGQGQGQNQQEQGVQLQGQGQAGQPVKDGAAGASAANGETAAAQGPASDSAAAQQQQQQQQQASSTMGVLPHYGGMPMHMPMMPMPGAPQFQYYPAGLKPALGGMPGPMAAMQAMQMGGTPTPHWPSMGVDSAQQDSLLRPPVA